MKGRPKRAGVFKYVDYDEHLLFSSRAGNFNAGNELLKRYFSVRYIVGRSLSPTIVKLLDSWEFNHAFFDAYNNACSYYKHFQGATVRTYFSRIMKHSLIAEASSDQVYQRINILSLDDYVDQEDGSCCAVCDIVQGDEDLYSDVTYYMNYIESVETFIRKDFKLNRLDKAVVKLRADGLTYEEIAGALSVSVGTARKSFMKFYESAMKTIKTNSLDKIKLNIEKLL